MEKLDLRYGTPLSLIFGTYSSAEIKQLSVVKIITPLSFNALGHPLPGGLYDPAMGPIDMNGHCTTCKLKVFQCSGHLGHIELPVPVINPLYHKVVASILKISCLHCHRILVPQLAKCLLSCQLKLLNKGFFIEAMELGKGLFTIIDTTWEYQKTGKYDIGTELTLIEQLERQVNDVLNNEQLTPLEFKGEGDLRNVFIKSALSSLYKGKTCPFCNKSWKIVHVIQNRILIDEGKLTVHEKYLKSRKSEESAGGVGLKFLTAEDRREHLRKLWIHDGEFIKALIPMLQGSHEAIDNLLMDVVLVTPTNARPCNYQDGMVVEHPQNNIYKTILNDCLVLKSIIFLMNNEGQADELAAERKEVVDRLKGKDYCEKMIYAWQELQTTVDTLLDVDLKKLQRTNGIGLKQIIEKKQGILRMNMMGKRVNFAARTVITPDPNLNIDEIGVPEAFAKKLTYPVVVTTWNVEELRALVINGPDVHPGANLIETEGKVTLKIDQYDSRNRESLAKRLLTPGDQPGYKVVHRHLVNGDILLVNRQPTLHRPSIMAHKARVLKGEKTFRLHYANCKSYNADFDGDEMNAHFPQNEVARSEGYNLVSVCKQYLVPKDGTPLSGLIQDHMISGVRLTLRGNMFSKAQYMQLVFQALSHIQGDIKILKPCIIKPVELWSGKQVVSTVLLNLIPRDKVPINLVSKAKIPAKAWSKGQERPWKYGGTPLKDEYSMTEAEVVIRGGELLCGVLDKTHYGATPYSLVHCLYELYGGEVSSSFLSSLAKLFTAYLQMIGFTLGVEDILLLRNADVKRKNFIDECRAKGDEIVSEVVDVPPGSTLKEEMAQKYAKDTKFRAILDHKYKVFLDRFTNNINKVCLPSGLLTPFPSNNLQLMVQSGAKGSTVNTMQISCLLGQIELEGKRPPLMISGKSLPSFTSYDTSPRAGGFVDGRFMTGIKPQEFFFHCMAGREGLIDTAVKTSRSGYLQRCLVKHLEGLNVNYDMTVRDSDGSVIQFLYGEDGLDVSKCQFLKKDQIPFLVDNMYAVQSGEALQGIKEHSEIAALKSYNKKIKKWKRQNPFSKRLRKSAFSIFTEEIKYSIDAKTSIDLKCGRSDLTKELCKMWYNLPPEEKVRYEKLSLKTPDTIVSKFQPDRNYGSITEKMDQLIKNYMLLTKGEIREKTVRGLINEKSIMALCPPGDPVGLLAAQSVGEPSTQMTLNTFHFAGRGEMNVTLGIPRLREILMMASKNIKTPSMVISFKESPRLEHHIKKLRRKLTKITLADVLETIYVKEKLQLSPRQKVLTLKMHFLPHEAYKEDTTVTPKQILKYVEKKFVKILFNALREKKRLNKNLITEKSSEEHGKRDKNDDEEEGAAPERTKRPLKIGGENYQSSEDEPEGDDDDATTARRRDRQLEEHQYSDLEDDASVQEEASGIKGTEETWDEGIVGDEDGETKLIDQEESKEAIDRTLNVMNHAFVLDYRFDTIKEEWCEVTLGLDVNMSHVDISSKLRDICQTSVVYEVPGIKKAYVQNDNSGSPKLRTDGVNLSEIFSYDKIIDFNKLYINDVHAMASIFGIEAALSVIVKEVQDVFKVYGITVDPRHLNLIASYMTFSGSYTPLSRKGMEGGASPLQQMTFESSLGFLRSAVVRGKKDDICSPSSRLMVGAPVKCGTGSFRLLHQVKLE